MQQPVCKKPKSHWVKTNKHMSKNNMNESAFHGPKDRKNCFKTDPYCARSATNPRGPIVGVALKRYVRSPKCVRLCVLSSVSHPTVE